MCSCATPSARSSRRTRSRSFTPATTGPRPRSRTSCVDGWSTRSPGRLSTSADRTRAALRVVDPKAQAVVKAGMRLGERRVLVENGTSGRVYDDPKSDKAPQAVIVRAVPLQVLVTFERYLLGRVRRAHGPESDDRAGLPQTGSSWPGQRVRPGRGGCPDLGEAVTRMKRLLADRRGGDLCRGGRPSPGRRRSRSFRGTPSGSLTPKGRPIT